MENWPWPRASPTGSSRPTTRLSTSGTHYSNAFWRKITFHLTNCSVWLPPLSRLLLGFHYRIDKRVSYKTCSNCGFINVHILTFLIVYIHSEMDSPHNVFVCGHTSFLSVSCASYMPENQQMSRSKITQAFFDFWPAIKDADSGIYLR